MGLIKKIIFSSFARNIYEVGVQNPLLRPTFFFIANKFSKNFLKNTQEKLSKISPSFCSAKWLQSTLHLEIGETHSCHHPKRHSLDFDQLILDPKKLHNTKIKAIARREMLQGIYPTECEYCWKSERCGEMSDRIYKSSAPWAQVDLEKLKGQDAIENIFPTYLEVSFSSACNLKCAYCYPEVSSSIRKEIEEFGPYPTSQPFGELKDYIEAKSKLSESKVDLEEIFWKWWNEGLYIELRNFRITGGEPLINKNTFLVLDKINELKAPLNLDFSINSNLMISDEKFDSFLNKIKEMLLNKKVKSFSFFASIDTWGKSAEFLRNGLDIMLFEKRVEEYLALISSAEITFMVTYQALSPFEFNDFLSKVLNWRKKYPKAKIKVGISELLNPNFLALSIDPVFLSPLVQSNLKFMQENSVNQIGEIGFSEFEIQHLERIYNSLIKIKIPNEKAILDFKIFMTNYQKRKKIDINEFFLKNESFINWYQSL